MSNQFKIHDDAWKTLKIFAIFVNEDGTWEKEWEPLRQADGMEIFRDLLSPISWIAYQELLHRHAKPFLKEVGLRGDACLKKIAMEEISLCYYREDCPSYDPKACAAHLTPPPCFGIGGSEEKVRNIVGRLVDLWRFRFYTILVQPENA
jgi:hypothetical protein